MKGGPYNVVRYGGKSAKFYLKDCVAGLNEDVKEKSVDIVVTSPP